MQAQGLDRSGAAGKLAGMYSAETPVQHRIECATQLAMIVIAQGNKAKRLQTSLGGFEGRAEHLGHSVHRTRLGLERHFHEVAFAQSLWQFQQTAGRGYGLEFSFGAKSAIQLNRGGNGAAELDARRTPRRVRLGEMGHS